MIAGLVIRRAVVSEQKLLVDLQWRASLTNEGDRDALLANPDAIEVPLPQIEEGRVYVAQLDGVIVGFSALEPREDGQVELDALFVDPELRRRGIARLLVERCVEAARAQGSTALHVIGNPHAKEFYLACGFVMTGTIQMRFGSGLLMRKTFA